ncbi:MAG: hypothetical protein HZA89_09510, partial [Verrucomicrobia bacterium]|nr:hypothetical protein [Verrucomicrobiota bacterium]
VNSTPDESAFSAGAAYVFVRSGGAWSQQAYLKASNAGANDNFGIFVSVSGDTVVVGANGEDSSMTGVNSTHDEAASNAGAAYIFIGLGPTANVPGAIAWFRAESNALDSVGPNHGTLLGGATFAAGQVGQAFSFSGANDAVSVPANAAMNFGSGDFAVEFWCRSSVSGVRMQPFTSHKNYGTLNLDFDFNDPDPTTIGGTQAGLWVFWNSSGNKQLTVGAPGAYTDGQWHHIALSRANSLMTLYVDGAAVASTNSTEVIDISSDTFIGNTEPGGMVWQGQVDEVTIYSRALTAAEVQAIYTAGSAGKAASGTAYLWNGNSGDWFTAANWSPPGVPGSNDTAVLTLGGVVDVSADATVANLTIGANMLLDGAGSLTVLGAANWTGGIMLGSGATVIAPGATLTISGDSEKRLVRRLDNFGTVTWSGARITGQNGPVINNHVGALFDIQTDATLYESYGGGDGTLNNLGTLRKSAGTGINYITGMFNSSGTVDVQTGTVQPVTTVALTNATFTGAGRFLLNGAPTTLDGTVTIAPGANFEFASGTITGTNTILGTFNWTGGILGSPGTTTVPTNSVLLVTGDNEKRLVRRLDNYGTVTWSGARITGENGPVFNNHPGALFDIQTDATLYENYGEILGTFNNSGILRKSAGTNINFITGTVNNSGTMEVQTGIVQPVGLLNLNTSSLTGAGRLLVNGATLMLNGTVTVANGSTFEFAAGTLGGTGTIFGTLNWTGGTMDAPGTTTIATNGALVISGSAEKKLLRQLDNYGTVTWSGFRITGQNGPVINNFSNALFDVQADATLFESYGGAVGTLTNSGLVRIAATNTFQGTFINTGTLELRRGLLALAGNYSPGAASALRVIIGGTAPGTDFGQFQIGGTAALAGTLRLKLTNDFIPTASDTFPIISAAPRASNFTAVSGAFIGGGLFFNPLYDATSMTLQVRAASTTNFTWNGSSGNWTDFARWTPTGIPDDVDTATINSGTVTVGASTVVSTLNLGGGTLDGAGTLTVTNMMNWTGGTMAGAAGTTTIAAGGALEMSGSSQKTLQSRTLNNAGTVTWSGTGALSSHTGGTINNLAGALLEMQSDASLARFNSALTLNNAGTIRKSGGTGTKTMDVAFTNNGTFEGLAGTMTVLGTSFNNHGLVRAAGGNVNLNIGGTNGGSFESVGANGIYFNGGTHTLTNGVRLIGTGTNYISSATLRVSGNVGADRIGLASGGTLDGAGALTVTNTMAWTGGTMGDAAGTTTIAAGGTLEMSGSSQKTLQSRTLNNAGTVTWSDPGVLSSQGGGVINNLAGALFEMQSDASLAQFSGALTINNAGTLRKSGGTGTKTMAVAFTNSGTVDIRSGVLSLSGSYAPTLTSTHRFAIGGYGAGTEFGMLQVSGTLTPAGQLDLLLVNSFVPTNGAAFPIVTAGTRNGTFATVTGRDIGGGLYFTPTYPAAGVTLLVAEPAARFATNFFSLISGQFQFRVQGIASETYRIDTSTNMSRATNWVPVATNVIPGAGYFDFTNAAGTNAPPRFFRAVFLP